MRYACVMAALLTAAACNDPLTLEDLRLPAGTYQLSRFAYHLNGDSVTLADATPDSRTLVVIGDQFDLDGQALMLFRRWPGLPERDAADPYRLLTAGCPAGCSPLPIRGRYSYTTSNTVELLLSRDHGSETFLSGLQWFVASDRSRGVYLWAREGVTGDFLIEARLERVARR